MKTIALLIGMGLITICSFSQEFTSTGTPVMPDIIELQKGTYLLCIIDSFTDSTISCRTAVGEKNEDGTVNDFGSNTLVIKKIDIKDIEYNCPNIYRLGNATNLNTIETSIGYEFIKGSNLSTTAAAFCCAGIGMIVLPYFLKNIKIETVKALAGGGFGLFFIGTVIKMSSMHHIKVAGKIMNIQAGKDGIGLNMKLNKPK